MKLQNSKINSKPEKYILFIEFYEEKLIGTSMNVENLILEKFLTIFISYMDYIFSYQLILR